MNTILETTIDLIQKINPTDKLGSQKKKFVLDCLEKQFHNPEEWELYRDFLSELVDFLVAVGKHKLDFSLVEIQTKLLSCCR
jgi:hypothetical protein